MLPLAVAIDLMTVSFRVIRHLKAFNSYKQEGFHLKEFLSQSYEKVAFQFGPIDIKKLEYNPTPITSYLVKKIEKHSYDSKIKKTILSIVAVISTQISILFEALIAPLFYPDFLHINYRKVITQSNFYFIDPKLIKRVKYYSLTELLAINTKKLLTDSKIINIALYASAFSLSFFTIILDLILDPFRFYFHLNNRYLDLITLAKKINSQKRNFVLAAATTLLAIAAISNSNPNPRRATKSYPYSYTRFHYYPTFRTQYSAPYVPSYIIDESYLERKEDDLKATIVMVFLSLVAIIAVEKAPIYAKVPRDNLVLSNKAKCLVCMDDFDLDSKCTRLFQCCRKDSNAQDKKPLNKLRSHINQDEEPCSIICSDCEKRLDGVEAGHFKKCPACRKYSFYEKAKVGSAGISFRNRENQCGIFCVPRHFYISKS